ncbi:uncharacterized protein LOC100578263 [Apis mellifera]|uniref:Uncharacterized protein LOC100578263 n=1 Tax=Apis mellifera TaxID=7460 RepID=A0A7M7M157_APIME|nr:uncharacterized protein LOC100578263 [Apis mellifera]|eukprot:XP_016771251.1 uncharacterized protein LOC100578263 [Apis mellifera]
MKIHPLTKLASRRTNGLLLSPLPPFAHLNEDIFIENRTWLGTEWTGRQVKMQDPVSRAIMHSQFDHWLKFARVAVTTVSLSSYAGKEPTFHSSCLAAVHQSQQRGRKRPHTQRKLYIFESDI